MKTPEWGSEAWCWWVTGLADGESYFRIVRSNNGASWSFWWGIKMRADDRPMLEEVHAWFGGRFYEVARPPEATLRKDNRVGTKPAVSLNVFRTDEVVGVQKHFQTYPLQSKKRRDFELWSEGFDLYSQAPKGEGVGDTINTQGNKRGTHNRRSPEILARVGELYLAIKQVRRYRELEEGT